VAELACPRDRSPLRVHEDGATCRQGHAYGVVHGVPVLLDEDVPPTHLVATRSLGGSAADAPAPNVVEAGVDPVVQDAVAATCGSLYRPLVGRLSSYPIPQLPLPPGDGRAFLEVGCHWGRWCIAAARQGYRPTGIDPSLEAILAARRVARQLGAEVEYVVADGRRLPFADGSFDVVFSYSVFQHFSRDDAVAAFRELGRVLKPGGTSLVQLANVWGVRSLWNQLRERRFREPRRLFDVRYWSPRELEQELERAIGPTRVFVDGFLTLNAQPADLPLLPRRYRPVVHASEALRRLSERFRPLTYVADSLYASSSR
jgi:SAM-dependent methyltransferase